MEGQKDRKAEGQTEGQTEPTLLDPSATRGGPKKMILNIPDKQSSQFHKATLKLDKSTENGKSI